VWTLRRSGARVTEIATTLNQQGVRTRRGTEWSRQVVAQLLARHPDAV
jgi:3'-phosphoadenosine 5'-phosphosulfate sulfotransferase